MFEYEYEVTFTNGDGMMVSVIEFVMSERAYDGLNNCDVAGFQAAERLRKAGLGVVATWEADAVVRAVRGGLPV